MNATENTNIHRYLDEAFAGIAMTPETQDLKEELRGNLADRALELQSQGTDATAAAQQAVAELGDIADLVSSVSSASPADAAALNRVRVDPGYVARTTLLALVFLTASTLVTLGAVGVLDWPLGVLVAIAGFGAAFPLSALVNDSLSQESSQRYPVELNRARAYGVSTVAGVLGVALCALAFSTSWLFIPGGVLAAASLVGFITLGVTQTNRTKPWALQQQRDYEVGDRFAQDPAAAARFGMYTVVIWILAFAGFAVLSITVGFAWSWLAILAGLVVFFLVLARMLFADDAK